MWVVHGAARPSAPGTAALLPVRGASERSNPFSPSERGSEKRRDTPEDEGEEGGADAKGKESGSQN